MEKKNNFGIIRLIGALMVITGHMYVLLGQGAPVLLWNSIHSFGIALFFSIGGYLITNSWTREEKIGRYFIKRIFRIFPALIFCVVITVFVIGPLFTTISIRDYFTSPITHLYLTNLYLKISYALPGVFENNVIPGTVNGAIWCLPVEFLMYIIIPLYIGIGNRLSEKMQKCYYVGITCFVILVGWIWTTWFYDTHYLIMGMDFSQIMLVIPYYFVGSFIAICGLEKKLNLQVAVFLLIVSSMYSFIPAQISYLLQYFVIPYVVLAFALETKPIFSSINRMDLSYGFFLFSFVIQQSAIALFIKYNIKLNIWILLLFSIIVSLFLGVVTEKIIEQPFGRMRQKILEKVKF